MELGKDAALTSAAIVAHVRGRGEQLTIEQLERWRQAGLVPAAHRISRGGRGGTFWIHPSGTIEQTIALLRLWPRKIGLPEAAVRLWLAGFDLEEHVVRRALVTIMDRLDERLNQLSPQRAAEAVGDGLARNAESRRRWGRKSRQEEALMLLTVERVVAAIGAGRALGRSDAADLGQLLTRDSEERAAIGQLTSDVPTEVSRSFDLLRTAPQIVRNATWRDLIQVRTAIPQFHDLVREIAAAPANPMGNLILRHLTAFDESSSFLVVLMLLVRTRLMQDKESAPDALPAAARTDVVKAISSSYCGYPRPRKGSSSI